MMGNWHDFSKFAGWWSIFKIYPDLPHWNLTKNISIYIYIHTQNGRIWKEIHFDKKPSFLVQYLGVKFQWLGQWIFSTKTRRKLAWIASWGSWVGQHLVSLGILGCHTVDGRNLAPGMYKTLQIMGYLPYQLVQDFWTINSIKPAKPEFWCIKYGRNYLELWGM